jgi:hypothetical protein
MMRRAIPAIAMALGIAACAPEDPRMTECRTAFTQRQCACMKRELSEEHWKLTANIIAIRARRGSQDEYNLALLAHTGSDAERIAMWMAYSGLAREKCAGPRKRPDDNPEAAAP